MQNITLAPRLDLSQAVPLATALQGHADGDLAVDASAVTHLGALGLQVLAAAARTWRAGGHRFIISPRSEAFDEALGLFGVTLADIQSQEAA